LAFFQDQLKLIWEEAESMLQGMFPKGKANEISSGIRYTIFLKTSRDQNSKLLGQVKIIGIQ